MNAAPTLSVVVALISGRKDGVRRCLQALNAQTLVPTPEILVPYDDPCAEVATLQHEFPDVRFLRARGLDTWEARAGRSREHHDTLRTMGLRAATGTFVALIEDHAYPAVDWGEAIVAAFGRHPEAAAVGGAVECEGRQPLSLAAWFCDFGRYQNPLPEARAVFVSDTNVAYRRNALSQVSAAWADDYHETTVHDAMARAGFDLWTTPHAVVWQARGQLRLRSSLRERYVWARSFAGTRVRIVGHTRWALAVLCPLLPFVITWRLARTTFLRGGYRRRFLACLPSLLVLQFAWAAGELVGYVTGVPSAGRRAPVQADRSTTRL